ncbi:hypothetical protein OHA70_05570 [Kribbella sp. NBC_00382]|uniref:hypothetical protein n=1 Tax=Kribbella sp. NBC_00382 TaxID=2975967 RepID=UPI002E1E118A
MESAEPRTDDDPYNISTRAARSTGTLVVPVSVDEMVHVVEDLSQMLDQPRLVSLSATGAEFKRGMSGRTFGLRITLTFSPLDAGQTQVRAACRPKLPTTLWDWGQGATDLTVVLAVIDQLTSSDRPGPEAR